MSLLFFISLFFWLALWKFLQCYLLNFLMIKDIQLLFYLCIKYFSYFKFFFIFICYLHFISFCLLILVFFMLGNFLKYLVIFGCPFNQVLKLAHGRIIGGQGSPVYDLYIDSWHYLGDIHVEVFTWIIQFLHRKNSIISWFGVHTVLLKFCD